MAGCPGGKKGKLLWHNVANAGEEINWTDITGVDLEMTL